MYKVLVADDDNMVRIAMKTILDWEAYGFTLCAVAENGKDALEQAHRFHPDLIITDVDMPVMNGLELIRRLREEKEDSLILILSNYSDFSYVRQGLREGALDYVLKVELNQVTLMKELEKAAKMLGEKDSGSDHSDGLPDHGDQGQKEAGADRGNPAANLYQIQIENGGRTIKPDAVKRVCIGVLSSTGKLDFEAKEENVFFARDTERVRRPDEAVRQIREQLRLYLGYSAEVSCREGEAGSEVRLAEEKRQKNDDWPKNLKYGTDPKQARELVERFSFAQLRESTDKGAKAIETLFQALPAAFASIQEAKVCLQERMAQSYWLIAKKDRACLGHILKQLEAAESLEEVRSVTTDYARQFIMQTDQREEVVRACQYINENFSRKITLDEIARTVGVKKTYLCTLFKAGQGQSIGEYILEQRLHMAQQLFAETDLRVNEVSAMVGIPDSLYFSKVFKAKFGVAPSRFRK